METVDNEVLQALSARKSVRVYTDEPVTEAERATSSCTRS